MKKLQWSKIKINIEKMWVPYFIIKKTPEEIRDILLLKEFKDEPYTNNPDCNTVKEIVYNMWKSYNPPYQLHARIYEDGIVRVHHEPDLRKIAHRISEEAVHSFFEKRGFWLPRAIRSIIHSVKFMDKFKLAFDLHEEDSVKSGIDLGDYVTGFRILNSILDIDFADVGFEIRHQLSIDDAQRIERIIRKIYNTNPRRSILN